MILTKDALKLTPYEAAKVALAKIMSELTTCNDEYLLQVMESVGINSDKITRNESKKIREFVSKLNKSMTTKRSVLKTGFELI